MQRDSDMIWPRLFVTFRMCQPRVSHHMSSEYCPSASRVQTHVTGTGPHTRARPIPAAWLAVVPLLVT